MSPANPRSRSRAKAREGVHAGNTSGSTSDSTSGNAAGSADRNPDGAAAQKNLQHVVAGVSALIPLIPANGVFEGQVSVQGHTRIDGSVRGTLRGTGRLELGPSARVEGTIECEEVCSQGAIVGPVTALRRAELGPGARLEGDLEAPTLAVADSAVWTGIARIGS